MEADGDSSDWARFAQTLLLNIAGDSVFLEVESTHVPDLASGHSGESALVHQCHTGSAAGQHTHVLLRGDTTKSI